MACFQVWTTVEDVSEIRAVLQHFIVSQSDFFEIDSKKLGGNVALLVYKRVPGNKFWKQVKTLEVLTVQRLSRHFGKRK